MGNWLRRIARIPEPPIESVKVALDRLDGHLECLANALGERRHVQVPVQFERRRRGLVDRGGDPSTT